MSLHDHLLEQANHLARLYLACFLLYKRFDEEPRGFAAAIS